MLEQKTPSDGINKLIESYIKTANAKIIDAVEPGLYGIPFWLCDDKINVSYGEKNPWEEPYPGFNKEIEKEMKEASLTWRTK